MNRHPAPLFAADPAASPSPGHKLALEGVSLHFGRVRAVDDLSLSVAPGEIVCLLGPSGSGKSSVLRLIAGVAQPTSGRVLIDGVEVAGPGRFVEPERRQVGMVFQDYALFPHLTVAANVAFGLRGAGRGVVDGTVQAMLERVGIERHATSYPHMLSGGERQRVALARALAPRPHVLLLDEPFSSLDSRLRDQVCQDTVRLLRDTGTTTLVVTHDPAEALRVADSIALLHQGRLVQCGLPEDFYATPVNVDAARVFGEINTIDGECRGGELHTPIGRFAAPGLPDGALASVGIRPQHLRVTTSGLSATVVKSITGARDRVLVQLDDAACVLVLQAPGRLRLQPGVRVCLTIDTADAVVVPREADNPVLEQAS